MTRRTFFIDNLETSQSTIKLSRQVSHHIVRVHRYQVEEDIELIDGRGNRWSAKIVGISKNDGTVTVKLQEKHDNDTESPLNIVLLCALARSDKTDLAIRQATELGVQTIILFPATRSAYALETSKTLSKRLERWRKIVREALCQCGRVLEPGVLYVSSLSDGVSLAKDQTADSNGTVHIVAYEKESRSYLKNLISRYPHVTDICACVGPESGWSDEEIDFLNNAGFIGIGLGPRILRYETAIVALTGLCQCLWGDMCCHSFTREEDIGHEVS